MNELAHDKLAMAAESLRAATLVVENVEVGVQLESEADHLSTLAGREKTPEKERITGHRDTLQELHGKVRDEDARAHISRAIDHVTSLEDAI